MWFRRLIASAACAALLGLAAAGLVRMHASEIASAMTPTIPPASQSDENVQSACGVSSVPSWQSLQGKIPSVR